MKSMRKMLAALALGVCCVVGAGSAASASVVDSGTLLSAEGNQITYEVGNDAEGIVTLTIKGKGSIANTGNGDCNPNEIPWLKDMGLRAHKLYVEEGITSIGSYAFQGMFDLGEIFPPDGLLEIKENAFDRCDRISEIHIPSSVKFIADWVFPFTAVVHCERDSYACTWAEEHGLYAQFTDCAHKETEWKVLRKPSCWLEGERGLVCLNPDCDVVLQREDIPKIAHTWGEWVTTREAADKLPEEQRRTCSVCKKDEFRYVQSKPPVIGNKVTSLKITAAQSTTMLAGKRQTLKVKVYPLDASNKNVTWKVSNSKYASVNSKGVVTAKAAGAGHTVKVYAIAKDGSGKKGYVTIKLKAPVKKITLKAPAALKAGQKTAVRAAVSVGRSGSKSLTWKSSNKKYATVTSKGVVKALKAGKGKSVVITAKAKDGSGTYARVRIRIK